MLPFRNFFLGTILIGPENPWHLSGLLLGSYSLSAVGKCLLHDPEWVLNVHSLLSLLRLLASYQAMELQRACIISGSCVRTFLRSYTGARKFAADARIFRIVNIFSGSCVLTFTLIQALGNSPPMHEFSGL